MTGAHRSPRAARATLWLPGLAVALGAAVATAHGLYEVALAAAVPAGIAWLYPLITDGLALVAYGATSRLTGSAARYAWAVVVTAAGLSGLAQAVYLASGATLDASPTLRFGIGAWPAVAAAVAAHLLYLLAALDSRIQRIPRVRTRGRGSALHAGPGHRPAGPVQPSSRPIPATGGTGRDRTSKPGTRVTSNRGVHRSRRPVHQHRRRPRPGPERALPPYGTPHATAPYRPSPRSRPPPTSPAAPPPPSSSHSAADPCRSPDPIDPSLASTAPDDRDVVATKAQQAPDSLQSSRCRRVPRDVDLHAHESGLAL